MTKADTADRYEGLRTRAHWKRDDAVRVLSDWAQSGESMAGFARRHRLGLHRLQWWRGQLKDAEQVAGAQALRLVPAVVRAPLLSVGTVRAAVSVVTDDGTRVEIVDPQHAQPQWVAALVFALKQGRP